MPLQSNIKPVATIRAEDLRKFFIPYFPLLTFILPILVVLALF